MKKGWDNEVIDMMCNSHNFFNSSIATSQSRKLLVHPHWINDFSKTRIEKMLRQQRQLNDRQIENTQSVQLAIKNFYGIPPHI